MKEDGAFVLLLLLLTMNCCGVVWCVTHRIMVSFTVGGTCGGYFWHLEKS